MSAPVKLVSPYPTMDEVAELYGISPTRLKQLKRIVQDVVLPGRSKVAGQSTGLSRSAAGKTTRGASTPSRVSKNSRHAQTRKRATRQK